MPLDARIELFSTTFDRWKPVLNDDNTLTLTFKCSHGYYRQVNMGKITDVPPNAEEYFGRCAAGRLYELQKALGIKLRIKSVDVSPLFEDVSNPVVFTFELVD
jgi:hydroxylamine reductase (hybrid-cluster protein)